MTSKTNTPKIDRFAILNEKQEVEAFAKKDFELQQDRLLCIAESRAPNADKNSYKEMLIRLDNEIIAMLDKKTVGSRARVINKLIKFALEELEKQNITIK